MKTKIIPLSSIDAPHEWHRPPSKIDDDTLRRSIEEGGIQQPLVVLADGKRFLVVDGIRRMKVAEILGISKVPAVIDEVPRGEKAEDYARRIRFIIDELRQDLRPSQQAELIERLKSQFKFNNTEVSQYLGIHPDTVTNYTALRTYVPEVVEAIDRGSLTMQAARVFGGMSDHGQKKLWKADGEELMSSNGAKMHKLLRKKYAPQKFPEFYKDANKIAARLGKKKAPRKRVARSSSTEAEKVRMMTSLGFRDAEYRVALDEEKIIDKEIADFTPICAAILRNPEAWETVSEERKPRFQRFYEIYC